MEIHRIWSNAPLKKRWQSNTLRYIFVWFRKRWVNEMTGMIKGRVAEGMRDWFLIIFLLVEIVGSHFWVAQSNPIIYKSKETAGKKRIQSSTQLKIGYKMDKILVKTKKIHNIQSQPPQTSHDSHDFLIHLAHLWPRRRRCCFCPWLCLGGCHQFVRRRGPLGDSNRQTLRISFLRFKQKCLDFRNQFVSWSHHFHCLIFSMLNEI